VPARYRSLLAGAARALASHRGYDRGALALARALARRLRVPLLAATTTRLLVDHNRTATHPDCFSRYTRVLAGEARARLLADLYWPHRRAVERKIAAHARAGRSVLHVAVHSFTPVLRGVQRDADVGLLYDPARAPERALCARWRRELAQRDARLRVRLNYPYRGTEDGLTTALRRALPARLYQGIEIELNQQLLAHAPGRRRAEVALAAVLAAALSPATSR
jgi:predicted N-formylglutamate amidohydrolase